MGDDSWSEKPPSDAKFSDLGLSEVMLAALAKAEYLRPTPVQAGLIPRCPGRHRRDGPGPHGHRQDGRLRDSDSGAVDPHKKGGPAGSDSGAHPRAGGAGSRRGVKLAHGRKVHCVALYGGKPIRAQIEKLERGAEIVVGTPGRVLDHLGRGTLSLDESDDRRPGRGRPDARHRLPARHRKDSAPLSPQSRQTLLLSATVPPPVERLARSYMTDPETLNFSPADISVETIDQYYCTVDPQRKFELLERLLKQEEPKQAIVFCRTKRGTDKVTCGWPNGSRTWPAFTAILPRTSATA